MSDNTALQHGAAPAYSEAEKGGLETPQLAYPKDEKKTPYFDEKKGAVDIMPVPELKKDSSARPSKPAPRPKKKASKWIVWQLWYNTYR